VRSEDNGEPVGPTFSDEAPATIRQEIIRDPAGATVVVGVAGEIDYQTEPLLSTGLNSALDNSDAVLVVVDLTEVSFFGSSGFAVLLAAQTVAREGGTGLKLVIPRRSIVDRTFELMGLSQVFVIHPSVADALGVAAPPAARGEALWPGLVLGSDG